MARLNQPADFSHATPAVSQVADVIAGSDAMSSPVLRPLSFEASLQSHGADQLPPSPLRRSSGQSPFSPADCRTLERLLRSTSVSSPPETPSPLEQGKHGAQLLQDTPSSPTGLSDRTDEAESYQSFGGEMTDTGYEDEDDSMELSEGTECANPVAVLDGTREVDQTGPNEFQADKEDSAAVMMRAQHRKVCQAHTRPASRRY